MRVDSESKTGDTLSDEKSPIILESMDFPDPVIGIAVEPKTKADVDKLGMSLAKLAEEDPTFQVKTDEASGQTVISGMGELHLDIIVDRLKREFKVEVNQGKPQVQYKEALTASAKRAGAIKKDGTIKKSWINKMAKKKGTARHGGKFVATVRIAICHSAHWKFCHGSWQEEQRSMDRESFSRSMRQATHY